MCIRDRSYSDARRFYSLYTEKKLWKHAKSTSRALELSISMSTSWARRSTTLSLSLIHIYRIHKLFLQGYVYELEWACWRYCAMVSSRPRYHQCEQSLVRIVFCLEPGRNQAPKSAPHGSCDEHDNHQHPVVPSGMKQCKIRRADAACNNLSLRADVPELHLKRQRYSCLLYTSRCV